MTVRIFLDVVIRATKKRPDLLNMEMELTTDRYNTGKDLTFAIAENKSKGKEVFLVFPTKWEEE